MKPLISRTFVIFTNIFLTTPSTLKQYLIILVVSFLFIWMPQKPPIDWDLNTTGFWSNIPQTYSNNPNIVYPPWGLILLLPYYLIQAAGSRMLSVMTLGWLTHTRKWSLSIFFALVFSPFFFRTMAKSNMDILVIVFPILIWEYSKGKRWENIARGISLALLLLKPQCTILLVIFLLWTNRKEFKKVLVLLGIAALFIVPISLIGTPPLFFQWLNNIIHPSSQNQYFWSINNISLTAKYGFLIAFGILFVTALILLVSFKARIISWKIDQITFSLLLFSMYLSPYTSQQSFFSGLAFIPSWPGFFLQWLGIGLGIMIFRNYDNIPLLSLFIAFLSLLLFSFIKRKNVKIMPSKDGVSQSI